MSARTLVLQITGRSLTRGLAILACMIIPFGCNPDYAVVAFNSSAEAVLIGRIGTTVDGDSLEDVVEVPIGTPVMLRSHYADYWPNRIVVMTQTCRVLADEQLSQLFNDGGSILIRSQDDIEFRADASPSFDKLPTTTARCEEVLSGLV